MFPLRTSILLFFGGFGFVVSRYEPDRIISLPGVSRMPSFPMYSGYLRVDREKELFYWFVTCEKQSFNDLIIWFNGGPGCSSLDGLFTENGPHKFDIHGNLYENPYSWNKLANVLYIESPAGVGFSRGPRDAEINDDTTSADAERALIEFFNKFQELSQANIYVTGESYAGFYVPILVRRLLDEDSIGSRIKGAMIGNPLLYQDGNLNSLIYFAYYHGLFGSTTWDRLIHDCCGGDYRSALSHQCDFYSRSRPSCMMEACIQSEMHRLAMIPKLDRDTYNWDILSNVAYYFKLHNEVIQVVHSLFNSGLNIYNLYHDCAPPETVTSMKYFKDQIHGALRSKVKEKYFGDKKHKLLKLLDQKILKLTPPCANSSSVRQYLNRPDVQRAIHVDNTVWDVCSQDISREFVKIYDHVEPFLKDILAPEKDIRVLLYFGDQDMACNHLGGEWIADGLKMSITLPRRSWTILKDGTDQIAGFVKIYDKLTYATVKGAGHMVPTDKPQVAYKMTRQFLNDEPL